MMRFVAAIAVILCGVGAVAAQQAALKESTSLMKTNGKNVGTVLSPMAKGEKPYDQAAVEAALVQLAETAKKLPALYPDSLKDEWPEGDYSPSPKIWENKSDFNARIATFAAAVTDAQAKIKNLDALKATLPAIGKQCSGCHETYRLKNG